MVTLLGYTFYWLQKKCNHYYIDTLVTFSKIKFHTGLQLHLQPPQTCVSTHYNTNNSRLHSYSIFSGLVYYYRYLYQKSLKHGRKFHT